MATFNDWLDPSLVGNCISSSLPFDLPLLQDGDASSYNETLHDTSHACLPSLTPDMPSQMPHFALASSHDLLSLYDHALSPSQPYHNTNLLNGSFNLVPSTSTNLMT